MLQRQENMGLEGRQFSVKAPLAFIQDLEDYALGRRMTKSAVVTLLLKKALRAEHGETYMPEKSKEAPK